MAQQTDDGMPEETKERLEAWLDEKNRIVSFHEIPDSRYCSTEEHDRQPGSGRIPGAVKAE